MIPLVSIVIPFYNAENYLLETINSVLSQTFTNWELILVNDGSTDSSMLVLGKFEDNTKIRIYSKVNGGVCSARNFGIEKAIGKYIALLDADDVWLPSKLSMCVHCLESKKLDFVFSDMYQSDDSLNNVKLAPIGKDSDFLNHLLTWNGEVIPGPASNLVIKRSCFIDGLSFDSKFSTAADLDLCIYLVSNYKGERIPEPLWIYRIIQTSMSRSVSLMEKDIIGVFKKANEKGMFKSLSFKFLCFSNIYLMIAGSWWVNGKNKLRASYFLFKSILIYPPSLLRIINKFIG